MTERTAWSLALTALAAFDAWLCWLCSWALAALLVLGVACCVSAAWWLTTWSDRVEDRR